MSSKTKKVPDAVPEAGQGAERSAGHARTLSRLGLSDPREALLCAPAAYLDCRQPQRFAVEHDERSLYLLTYTGDAFAYRGKQQVANLGTMDSPSAQAKLLRSGLTRVEIVLRDAAGQKVTRNLFGNLWPAREIAGGDPALFLCRMERFGRNLSAQDVEVPPPSAIGKVWVRYKGIPGQVTGEAVEQLVTSQLDNPDAWRLCATRMIGALCLSEPEILAKLNEQGVRSRPYSGLVEVLKDLHQPAAPEDGEAALQAVKFLTALAIQSAALRHNTRVPHPDAPIAVDPQDVERLAATQPERLTSDQLAVATAITRRLGEPRPLQGLLSGDVGTGKTLTFLLPAVAASRAGARVMIVAPTDLLADQIAGQVLSRFGGLVEVERVQTGKKIANRDAILVGSPGITSVAQKCDYSPNLLICDEQHKHSTQTRERLIKPWTHLIEATATPIPRSLASVMYGGMEVFNLRTCPVEKNIGCRVYDVKERSKASAMLRWALANGKRAAVVYPRVDSKTKDSQTVLSAFHVLDRAFPGKVAMLHGKMSDAEKRLAMDQVRSGEKPLVVASTVLETGIDIPSVAAMVVRDADCFGISQLHQLRGRLVRNGGEGWFAMLINDKETAAAETLERLQAVAENMDGYKLAEIDLVQRGIGDVDGTAQSGNSETLFRLVNLKAQDLLERKLGGLQVQVDASTQAAERDERPRERQGRLIA